MKKQGIQAVGAMIAIQVINDDQYNWMLQVLVEDFMKIMETIIYSHFDCHVTLCCPILYVKG
jgi:hypothetical protein